MKISDLIKIVMAFCVFLVFTGEGYAQESSGVSSLIGKWHFQYAPSYAGMSTENKEILESSPDLKAQILKIYINRVLYFGPNGGFEQIDGNGNRVEGIWTLSGQTLTITDPSGNIWVQTVAQLTERQIVLRQNAMGEGQPVFSDLYFIKTE